MKLFTSDRGPARSRRDFVKQLCLLGSGSALTSTALPLSAIAATVGQSDDYKALVCIYLEGGLDHLQTVVPHDPTSYNALAALRPGFLPARSNLAATRLPTFTSQGGREASLYPTLAPIKPLYDQGRLAVIYGSGNLEEPVTRAGLYSGAQRLPQAAGSHNDGQSFALSGGAEGTTIGWGGRLCDTLSNQNTDAMFSSITVGSSSVFGAGNTTRIIAVGENALAMPVAGTTGPLFGSSVASAELRALLARGTDGSALGADYLAIGKLVQDSAGTLQQVFAATQSIAPIPTDASLPNYQVAWRDNRLVSSLRTVLRIIHQRALLGARRQVFFVRLTEFDTHGGAVSVLGNNRLVQLGTALRYFQDSLAALGLADKVSTFTTSEFGRALTANGDGTDHGWGGVQFVMGGAVRGGDIYGALQDISPMGPGFQALGGPPNSIPFIAHEQVLATLARWFGASDTSITDVFPRLSRFSPRYLDFMLPA